MRRALAMYEDAEIGIFAKQSSACAGMVQMNMREQDGLEVRHGKSASPQLRAQSFQRGGRARVENCVVAVRFKKNSADRVRAAHPIQIEYGSGIHIVIRNGTRASRLEQIATG